MSDAPFDPYYMWLGIPPEDQPPNLYRLLGIAVFEQNLDVIDAAAHRQISHLRTYAIGPKSELSQELLNEVASARATLLNPARKAEYDQALMQSQAAPTAVPPPSFSPSVTPARRTSRKKKSSWSKPLLVSGLLVISVVISIALLKALQEDTEVAQAPRRPAIQSEETSQDPTTKKPSVNRRQATTSANPEVDDTSSQSSDANSAQAFAPAATTSSDSDQLPPTAPQFQNGTPPPAVAPFNPEEAKQHQQAWADYLGVPVECTNSIGMKLRLVPPGTFMMGSEDGEEDERPEHQVELKEPFYAGIYEVTQTQFLKVTGANPSKFKGVSNPVESVTWNEAVEFCRLLSSLPKEKAAGRNYRLPTEAQWEYACRAGTTTRYNFGDDERQLDVYAWYGLNSNRTTHPVGEKLPNTFGLYDVHGNVWEWCHDWYADYPSGSATNPTGPSSGSRRVYRGSSWDGDPKDCNSWNRREFRAIDGNEYLGFRVVADINSPANADSKPPKDLLSQKQLEELLVNNPWQLDYFSKSAKRRLAVTWRFLPTGQVTGAQTAPYKGWRIENDTLITVPDGYHWKYNQELQRWDDSKNIGKPENKKHYINKLP